MSFSNVNFGTSPGDHTGDPLRSAFNKVNDNFQRIASGQVYANTNVATYLSTNTIGSLETSGNIIVGGILSSPQNTKASNSTGSVGQVCWDTDYIYICTATDTWKRVALTGGY